MQVYGNDMKRIAAIVILAAVIIASLLILVFYQIENQPDPPEIPQTEHSSELPTAQFTVILESGSDGTQVVGGLEFGFVESQNRFLVGYIGDWLQIHDGFNKSGVLGLGYTEAREYAFAYVGDEMLFDDWAAGIPSGISRSEGIPWTPDSLESSHSGDMPLENLTNAGFIIEFIDLRMYFRDGTSFICGPNSLSIGVNFTLISGEWQVDYIVIASDYNGVSVGTDSLTIQVREDIPDMMAEVTVTATIPAPAADFAMPFTFVYFPSLIGGAAVLLVVVLYKHRKAAISSSLSNGA